ncbi:MAG: sel1 repeat family protein [Proteobacteria bacterium]|nr:sel1 repeat family protein [Pseudomonadota bacterium]
MIRFLLLLATMLLSSLLSAASLNPGILASSGFLEAHPDVHWRVLAMQRYRKGNYTEALDLFRRASRYADKSAQGMVAEMLWQGKGAPADRALAYAWMDLAAERAYPQLAMWRERYWQQLAPDEQRRALTVGKAVYAEYRDSVAKPRLENKLRLARLDILGWMDGADVLLPAANGNIGIAGQHDRVYNQHYYDPNYWDPKLYWKRIDNEWKAAVTVGSVSEKPLP